MGISRENLGIGKPVISGKFYANTPRGLIGEALILLIVRNQVDVSGAAARFFMLPQQKALAKVRHLTE